jgi:hypothetical protein
VVKHGDLLMIDVDSQLIAKRILAGNKIGSIGFSVLN